MGAYLSRRLLRALATIAGVVTLVFALIRLVPGDPVESLLGDQASPEDRALMRERLHLDDALPVQFGRFVGDVVGGTLGTSFRTGETVSSMIVEVLPETALLAFWAILVAWLLALPLGIVAARFRGRAPDRIASGLAVAGLAIPNIWLGPLLILAFGVQLRWAPLPGDDQAGAAALILPAITLGTALAATLTRQTRGSLIEVLSQNYVLAARARGLPPTRVMIQAFRNASFPVLTVGAAQLGAVLSGTVVVETIFERRGLGTLFLDGFFARDYPVVAGCAIVIAAIYVFVNFAMDVAYMAIDPRVRLA